MSAPLFLLHHQYAYHPRHHHRCDFCLPISLGQFLQRVWYSSYCHHYGLRMSLLLGLRHQWKCHLRHCHRRGLCFSLCHLCQCLFPLQVLLRHHVRRMVSSLQGLFSKPIKICSQLLNKIFKVC